MLLVAPLLYAFVKKSEKYARYLTWFINLYIIFAVLVHILPESFMVAGWWAVLLAVMSMLGFWLFESYFESQNLDPHSVVLLVAMFGLLLHMMVDGAALNLTANHQHSLADFKGHDHTHLAWAVVAHRLPVGMFLWSTLRKYFSPYKAYASIIVMSIATFLGYLNSHLLMDHIQPELSFALLQSVVGGALLHCIWHPLHK